MSMIPASDIKWAWTASSFSWDEPNMDPRIPALASSLLMSTHVSAAFSQNTPIKGERCKYQNNSKIKNGETRKIVPEIKRITK